MTIGQLDTGMHSFSVVLKPNSSFVELDAFIFHGDFETACNYDPEVVDCCAPPVNINDPIFTDFKIDIFPNPTSSQLTISFSLKEAQEISIEMIDVNGRRFLLRENEPFEQTENVLNLELEGIPSGIYYLTMTGTHSFVSHKIVVAK